MYKSKIFLILLLGLSSLSSSAFTFVPACLNSYLPTIGKYGERFFLDSTNRNKGIENPSQLKIVSQNFENLGLFKEYSRIKTEVNGEERNIKVEKTVEKSYGQNLRMAARLRKQSPDIIIGMEVKDIETAQNFSKEFLNDEYQAILIEGNDDRGIDVCFFVKRTLDFDFEVQSHRKYSLTNQEIDPVFSRDFPVLLVRPAGAQKYSRPLMALFATHLKSQIGGGKKAKPGEEPKPDKTVIKRTEQAQASIEIMAALAVKYPGIPMLMGGDYNGDIRVAPEFASFYRAGLADALNFDNKPLKPEERFSQYFFKLVEETADPYDSVLIASQLDAMMVNPEFAKFILAAGIQRDVRPDGTDSSFPKKPDQVNKRASDHDGMFLVVDLITMLKQLNP
jgi:hypothetical protein